MFGRKPEIYSDDDFYDNNYETVDEIENKEKLHKENLKSITEFWGQQAMYDNTRQIYGVGISSSALAPYRCDYSSSDCLLYRLLGFSIF